MTDALNALYSAREGIKNNSHFRFADWTHCTCGYIFRAVMGRFADDEAEVCSRHSPHMHVMETIARAAGWEGNNTAPSYLSAQTVKRSPHPVLSPDLNHNQRRRTGALAVIDEAIAALEAEQGIDTINEPIADRELVLA